MARAPLHIARTGDGLQLEGEVDVSNARHLQDALAPLVGDSHDVVLEASGVAFMDSTAIQVLLRAGKEMPDGFAVVIQHPGPLVLNLLRLIGADRMPGLRIVDPPG